MFDLDRFKGDCCTAATGGASQQTIREIVARAVDAPGAVLKALGEPRRAEVHSLHRSADLTILNVIWGPRMTVMPHNHNMWAIIAIYTGREDNILWRRVPDDPSGRIEAAGAKALSERDALPLGRDIIHSVTNPIGRLTGAIHVYGGDFFAVPRSEWGSGAIGGTAGRCAEDAAVVRGKQPSVRGTAVIGPGVSKVGKRSPYRTRQRHNLAVERTLRSPLTAPFGALVEAARRDIRVRGQLM